MAQADEPRDGVTSPLVLEESTESGGAAIAARGEIDVATSPALRAKLDELIADTPEQVTLDFRGVTFVDSSGLGVLVGALKKLRESRSDARFRIVGLQDGVRKVFDITGLDGLFELRS